MLICENIEQKIEKKSKLISENGSATILTK